MQKKFLSNLILIVVLNLMVKPFFILGIDAEVQNRVGEEIYGNYFSILNFTFLLNILLDFGTTNFNTRSIAQSPQLITKHFYKILWLRFTFLFVYATFTLALGLVMGYSSEEYWLIGFLMINQFLVAIIQFNRSNFLGLHLFRTDALISVLDRTLLILFCSVLLWSSYFKDEFKIEWFVYAQSIAYGLTAILSLVMLSAKIGKIKIDLKKSFSVVMLKQSFPYALLILLMMTYTRVDAVMIERLLPDGDYQAGVYAQGYRYLDAVNMFALMFAGLLLPIFSRLIKLKESILPILGISSRLLIGASVIVATVLYLYRLEFLNLLYDNVSVESSETFGILILSFIPISVTYVFGTLLTANGNLKSLNQMAAACVGLNLILNFIFIELWHAQGAAIATLITQSAMAIIQIVIAVKIFKLKTEWLTLLKIIALALVIVLGYYLIKTYSELSLANSLIVLFAISIGLAFSTKLFKLSEFKDALSLKSEG